MPFITQGLFALAALFGLSSCIAGLPVTEESALLVTALGESGATLPTSVWLTEGPSMGDAHPEWFETDPFDALCIAHDACQSHQFFVQQPT